MQTLDILVDGPQADLIREEATALRAESGLVPGHEGAQVASAAKQSETLDGIMSCSMHCALSDILDSRQHMCSAQAHMGPFEKSCFESGRFRHPNTSM